MTQFNATGAYEQAVQILQFLTSGSFASLQFTFVQINASGQAAPPSGAGVYCDGVIMDDNPNSGTASPVAVSGVVEVVSGGVTAGDLVMTDANGKAVTATGSNHIMGRALATGVSGTIVPVLLGHGGHASTGV